MGTRVEPRRVPLLFGVVVIPMTFLGATYYPWALLSGIRWLQLLVLVNPLVYMSEAMRAAFTPDLVPHMQIWVIYVALIGFTLALGWIGVDGFRKRVLS
jgi:ABC-2 type transport system permease protein